MIKKLVTIFLSTFLLLQIMAFMPIASAQAFDFSDDEEDFEYETEGTEQIGPTAEEEDTTTSMPSIPKPAYLPGPDANSDQASIQEYFKEKAIPDFISGFIGVVGLMAFVSLIVAGVQFLTAYGNEESIATAKRTAQWAIVGFVIAILSYAIVSIIGSVPLNGTSSVFSIPTTDAIAVEDLLPAEEALIEASPNAQGASLPSGDLALDIIPQAINMILYIVSTIIFATLVYAGILLVIGQGKEEDITKAKNIIVYAIVGIITIAISYGVIYGIARLNL